MKERIILIVLLIVIMSGIAVINLSMSTQQLTTGFIILSFIAIAAVMAYYGEE